MKRCIGWDYRKPYHYLVTLKCLPGLPALSRFDPGSPWGLEYAYPLTRALAATIDAFAERSPGIASVTPYVIMPDHIHLLIKLSEDPDRLSLPKYVMMLKAFLRRTYHEETGIDTPLFETEWHDLICKRSRQLGNFIHYIVNNAHERLIRLEAKDLFHCHRAFRHYRLGDAACDLVGDPGLLDEPALVAVRLSRRLTEGSAEWARQMAFYDAWRPGMTAVGTWWSPAEREAGRRIIAAGANVIRLSPEGFAPRWHPAGEESQRLCAEGRVAYLSPYPPHTGALPPGELRARCLALNARALRWRGLWRAWRWCMARWRWRAMPRCVRGAGEAFSSRSLCWAPRSSARGSVWWLRALRRTLRRRSAPRRADCHREAPASACLRPPGSQAPARLGRCRGARRSARGRRREPRAELRGA